LGVDLLGDVHELLERHAPLLGGVIGVAFANDPDEDGLDLPRRRRRGGQPLRLPEPEHRDEVRRHLDGQRLLVGRDLDEMTEVAELQSVAVQEPSLLEVDRHDLVDPGPLDRLGHQRVSTELLGHLIGHQTVFGRRRRDHPRVCLDGVDVDDIAVGRDGAGAMQLHRSLDQPRVAPSGGVYEHGCSISLPRFRGSGGFRWPVGSCG
jgi:hypothetical protein